MFLTVCLPVGDWLRVDLVGSFSVHVMETAMCISQVSAQWEGFPLPLTFRVSLEWVHNLLSTHFWLSWVCYVANQAMLFPSLFTGCRELRMRRLCGSRQMCWGCGSKCMKVWAICRAIYSSFWPVHAWPHTYHFHLTMEFCSVLPVWSFSRPYSTQFMMRSLYHIVTWCSAVAWCSVFPMA